MDHWSKYHMVFPLMRKSCAKVAFGLHRFVFSFLGTPKILHSDNGKEFVNDIIDNHFSDWPGDTTIVNRRPRNPRCQGLVEKGNALEKLLGAQLLEAADLANGREMLPWTTWLPTIQCKLIHSISSLFSALTCFVCYLDQLNTTVHATMKTNALSWFLASTLVVLYSQEF